MCVVLAALLALSAAPASTPAAPPELIAIHVNPFLDMHHWVRHLAEQKSEPPAVAGLAAAVAAARQLDADLGSPLAWGPLEGGLVGANDAASFSRLAADLPESFAMRGGATVHLRAGAVRLAAAYRDLEQPFLQSVWPRHREAVERAEQTLRRDLLPHASAVYADVAKSLGSDLPARPFDVYLVAAGPFPGAVTHRGAGGRGVSIVAADAAQGTQWLETVVHETIHSLDVGGHSVLDELRDRLAKVQPAGSPREIHDFVHTLIFVQAAGSVRRVIDPAHRDYGDVDGYYAKVPAAAAVVVPAWRAYMNGEISRQAAVDRIVEGFAAASGYPGRGEGHSPAWPRRATSTIASKAVGVKGLGRKRTPGSRAFKPWRPAGA